MFLTEKEKGRKRFPEHTVWVSPNAGEARGRPDMGWEPLCKSLAVPLKTKRYTHSPYDPRITVLGVYLR